MTYNGYKNRNHYNVSLWIGNDEGLYRLAQECIASTRTREEAASMMLGRLANDGITETPDGAPFSATSIRAAMVGM